MKHKLVNLPAGQVPCPVSTILHFQSQKLHKVTLEPSSSFRLYFEGNCPNEGAVIEWFEAFLSGKHLPFPLELSECSGSFSTRVLEALGKVPFGGMKTYGEIAAQLDNPKGARAVGNACNRNPFPLIIPCHRIVMSNGKMGGFAYGCSMKEDLLEFERQITQTNQTLRP